MMESTMKNRYGVEYEFKEVSNNTYTIKGELTHWRFGGKEGESELNTNDLGFVDPSGGPYVALGNTIHGRKITKIYLDSGELYFDVA